MSTGGGPKAVERHLSRKKLLVRDRVNRILDNGTAFLELGQVLGATISSLEFLLLLGCSSLGKTCTQGSLCQQAEWSLELVKLPVRCA